MHIVIHVCAMLVFGDGRHWFTVISDTIDAYIRSFGRWGLCPGNGAIGTVTSCWYRGAAKVVTKQRQLIAG